MVWDLCKTLCFHSVLSSSTHQPLSDGTTGSCWKQLQRQTRRRVTPARNTGQGHRKLARSSTTHQNLRDLSAAGLYAPFLFISTPFGQRLVSFFILEIILLKKKNEELLFQRPSCTNKFGFWVLFVEYGAVHLHFSWPERKSQPLTSSKIGWFNAEHSRRCWCRHKACCLLSSTVSLIYGRIFLALPDVCFSDTL